MRQEDIIQTKVTACTYDDPRKVEGFTIEVHAPNLLGVRMHDIPRSVLESPEGMESVLVVAALQYKNDLKKAIDRFLRFGLEEARNLPMKLVSRFQYQMILLAFLRIEPAQACSNSVQNHFSKATLSK